MMKRALVWLATCAGLMGAAFFAMPAFLCGGDEPVPADAIVILAGGHYTTGRLAEGLRLAKLGFAPRLVVSGVEYNPQHPAFDAVAWSLWQTNGCGRAMIVDEHSRITRESVVFVRDRAAQEGWRTVLVVTSRFHWRRTRALFRHAGGDGLTVRVCTVNDVE